MDYSSYYVETLIESKFQPFRQIKKNFDIPNGKPLAVADQAYF